MRSHEYTPNSKSEELESSSASSFADQMASMPSFEEHMASIKERGTQSDNVGADGATITSEAKDAIIQAAIHRDEASRIRLDIAGARNLSPEEQEELLNKEIAIEEADKRLVEDLASDNGTVSSMQEKLKDSMAAVNNATAAAGPHEHQTQQTPQPQPTPPTPQPQPTPQLPQSDLDL